MSLDYDQLPASMKRQVDGIRTKAPSRPRKATRAACAGFCGCSERFESYGRWESHSDREGRGHRRWSVDLG